MFYIIIHNPDNNWPDKILGPFATKGVAATRVILDGYSLDNEIKIIEVKHEWVFEINDFEQAFR